MPTNQDVINAFMQQRAKRTTHLVSDGISLWSYGWWECARWVEGRLIKRKGKSYSQTTASKHRRVWQGVESTVETPVDQGRMNVEEIWTGRQNDEGHTQAVFQY